MSIEYADYDGSPTEETNEQPGGAWYKRFERVLTPGEYDRLQGLSTEAARTALTTAFFAEHDVESSADALLIDAYLQVTFGGQSVRQAAASIDVHPKSIRQLRRDMPRQLANSLPPAVWREPEQMDAEIITAEFRPAAERTEIEVHSTPAPVFDLHSHARVAEHEAVPEVVVPIAETQPEPIPDVPETVTVVGPEAELRFDPEFNFFEAAVLMEPGDVEWRDQGQEMFTLLEERGVCKQGEAAALWGHVMLGQDRVKKTTYAIYGMYSQHKKGEVTVKYDDKNTARTGWLFTDRPGKGTNMATEFHNRLRRSDPELTLEQTRCIILGLVGQLYGPELAAAGSLQSERGQEVQPEPGVQPPAAERKRRRGVDLLAIAMNPRMRVDDKTLQQALDADLEEAEAAGKLSHADALILSMRVLGHDIAEPDESTRELLEKVWILAEENPGRLQREDASEIRDVFAMFAEQGMPVDAIRRELVRNSHEKPWGVGERAVRMLAGAVSEVVR